MSILRFDNVSYQYPGEDFDIIDGLSFSVEPGSFHCIVGVSGCGKSSLVNEVLYKSLGAALNRMKVRPGKHDAIEGMEQLDKVIAIDQSPIGRTPRSNPATYTNLFNLIRDLFLKIWCKRHQRQDGENIRSKREHQVSLNNFP